MDDQIDTQIQVLNACTELFVETWEYLDGKLNTGTNYRSTISWFSPLS